MSDLLVAVLPGLCTGILSLIGVYAANRKSATLMEYRLKELEKKVDKHNQVVERTFALEGRMNEAEHDIRDLKGRAS
jgi:hypothetical protein